MEEVTGNETIAVMMDYLVCHEVVYLGRKDPIFVGLCCRRSCFLLVLLLLLPWINCGVTIQPSCDQLIQTYVLNHSMKS